MCQLLYEAKPGDCFNNAQFVLGMMCIVKPDGPPQLCKTDEIGEICVSSRAGGMMYYGLAGVTKNTFEVRVVEYIFFPRFLCRTDRLVKSLGFVT